MALYSNNDAWMYKNVPVHLGMTRYEMYFELPTMSIDYFETIVDLFMNTYYVYNDVRKCHEAMFRPPPQIKDESLIAYLKRFWAKLAEVEKPNDKCLGHAQSLHNATHNMHLSCQE